MSALEKPVHDGDHAAEFPVPHVVFDFGQHRLVVAVARPAPAAHRDAFLGHGEADDDLRQVRPVVLGVSEPAECLVALVFVVAFEVGRGGVEEQQVDFQVEQVGHGEEHRLLHPPLSVGVHE